MFKKTNEFNRERTELKKEIDGLKLSITGRNRNHEQTLIGYQDQIKDKDLQILRYTEEIRTFRQESEVNESKLRGQIQRM